MSTTQVSGRFATLPDDETLNATVVALEEHGFSVEVADDFDTADLMAMNELFDENGPIDDGTAESVITIDKDEQVEEVE